MKPGSSLVFSCRSSNSGEVMRLFDDNNDNLKYWSIFSGKYSRNHYKVDRRHVYAEWNPMLWYVKGERANNLTLSNTIGVHIEAKPSARIFHDWEQS